MIVFEGELYFELREYDRPNKVYFGKLIDQEKGIYEPVNNEMYEKLYNKYLKLPDIVYIDFKLEEKVKKIAATLGIVIMTFNAGATDVWAAATAGKIVVDTKQEFILEDEPVTTEKISTTKGGQVAMYDEYHLEVDTFSKDCKRFLQEYAQKNSISNTDAILTLFDQIPILIQEEPKVDVNLGNRGFISAPSQMAQFEITEKGILIPSTINYYDMELYYAYIFHYLFLKTRAPEQVEFYTLPTIKGIGEMIQSRISASYLDFDQLKKAYYQGDQKKIDKVIENSFFGKEKTERLYTLLGQGKREEYYKFLTECETFTIVHYTKDEDVRPLWQSYDTRIHEKAKELSFSTENWDTRKEEITVSIFEQGLFNHYMNKPNKPVAGYVTFLDNHVRIGDWSVQSQYVWNHEFTHVASFKKDSSTLFYGPFQHNQARLYEEYNTAINSILFPEFLDVGYGYYTLMDYLFFLGDGKALVQAYFENDFDLFLKAFPEEIIKKEDLLFMLDYSTISLASNVHNQEQVRFFSILKDAYIRKVMSLSLSNKEEYEKCAAYFNSFEIYYFEHTLGLQNYPVVDMGQILSEKTGMTLEIQNYNGLRINYLEDGTFSFPEYQDENLVGNKIR